MPQTQPKPIWQILSWKRPTIRKHDTHRVLNGSAGTAGAGSVEASTTAQASASEPGTDCHEVDGLVMPRGTRRAT